MNRFSGSQARRDTMGKTKENKREGGEARNKKKKARNPQLFVVCALCGLF